MVDTLRPFPSCCWYEGLQFALVFLLVSPPYESFAWLPMYFRHSENFEKAYSAPSTSGELMYVDSSLDPCCQNRAFEGLLKYSQELFFGLLWGNLLVIFSFFSNFKFASKVIISSPAPSHFLQTGSVCYGQTWALNRKNLTQCSFNRFCVCKASLMLLNSKWMIKTFPWKVFLCWTWFGGVCQHTGLSWWFSIHCVHVCLAVYWFSDLLLVLCCCFGRYIAVMNSIFSAQRCSVSIFLSIPCGKLSRTHEWWKLTRLEVSSIPFLKPPICLCTLRVTASLNTQALIKEMFSHNGDCTQHFCSLFLYIIC